MGNIVLLSCKTKFREDDCIIMNNKDYIGKLYKTFCDFVSLASSRELEYIIFDAKYTTYFNSKMRKVLNDINKESKKETEFSIMFNTKGEVAVIDSRIVGKYIGNYYNIEMENYYKGAKLNKIIWDVMKGSNKVKSDFVIISYKIIYRILNEIYMEIKYSKNVLKEYKLRYGFEQYTKKDISIVIISILILEDICTYIGIDEEILLSFFKKICD